MALTTNLISYWKLDDNYTDEQGTNNGSIVGAGSYFVTGNPLSGGKALHLDGHDEYVNGGNDSSLTFGAGQSFTYSAWIGPYIPSGWDGIIYHGAGSTSQGHMGLNPSKQLTGGLGDGSAGWVNIASTWVPSSWGSGNSTMNHVALTVDKSAGDNNITMKLFGDGVLRATVTGASAVPNAPSDDLRIGWGNPGGYEGWYGRIDDVAIWGRALTPSEITAIHSAGNAGDPLSTLLVDDSVDGSGFRITVV